MKILHIIPDDKFWECPIKIFSSDDYECEYISIVDDSFECFNYISSDIITPVNIRISGRLWGRDDIDVFMFHSIPPKSYSMISSIPDGKVVIAASWGYDIYTSMAGAPALIPIGLYKSRTYKLLNKKSFKDYIFISRSTIKRLINHSEFRNQRALAEKHAKEMEDKQNHAIRRIDYLSTVLPCEYELMKNLDGFRAKYFPFQYSTDDVLSRQDLFSLENAEYILLGNSADPANNHIDVVSILKKRGITNKIYIPLAYGSSKYALDVSSFISKRNIHAEMQMDFIPYNQYKEKLCQCRVGIFGHIRQQSVGNINICLLQGKKVFLYKDSIVYKYYKSIGCNVFSIEDDLCQESINLLLTEEQIRTNIEALSFFSYERVKDNVKNELLGIKKELTNRR